MKCYIMRHGITQHNKMRVINGQRIDEPLIVEGIEQAKKASKNIPSNVKKIYSSNMLLTRQTSDILNKELNLEVSYHPELREVDFGDLSGKTWAEAEMDYGHARRESYLDLTYDFEPFNGESISQVKKRLRDFLEKIKRGHKEDDAVMMVTHGGVLRALYDMYKNEKVEKIENVSIHEFDI